MEWDEDVEERRDGHLFAQILTTSPLVTWNCIIKILTNAQRFLLLLWFEEVGGRCRCVGLVHVRTNMGRRRMHRCVWTTTGCGEGGAFRVRVQDTLLKTEKHVERVTMVLPRTRFSILLGGGWTGMRI